MAVLCLCTVLPLRSAVSSSESTFQGKRSVIIENELYRLTFVPETGGRCLSFKDLKTGFDFVKPGYWGMFVDHWANLVWPSGLMHLPYTAKVAKTADSVSVTLSIVVPEKGGGAGSPSLNNTLKMPTAKELIGLKLSKTITLKSGSPVIYVKQMLENPTDVSKSAALSFQHHFDSGKSGARISNMPDMEGLIGPVTETRKLNQPGSGKNWCISPVAGWNSIYDPKHNQGIGFAFDYNLTDKIYSSGLTAEWFLESVTLPPKGSFETEYTLRVLKGLNEVVYVSKDLAAGAVFREKPSPVTADFYFQTMENSEQTVNMQCEIYSGEKACSIEKKNFNGIKLGPNPKMVSVSVPVKDPSVTNYTVFRWTITRNDGKKEYFELNYIGNENDHQRRYHFGEIEAGSAALAGTGAANSYRAFRPAKILKREKFDLKKIRANSGKADSVLVLFGLYTNFLRIHEALSGTFGKKLRWANGIPNGIQGFPGTREELFRNKLVVMSNINFNALRHSRLFMLDDFVREGGTLLITGGFYTYGHGEFKGSIFEELSPLEGMRPFELRRENNGKPFLLKKTGVPHPLSSVLNIDKNNEVAYLHELKAKKDAVVLAAAGKHPAIVVRKHGNGQVVACTMTVMGEAKNPWYDGAWWKDFLKELAK